MIRNSFAVLGYSSGIVSCSPSCLSLVPKEGDVGEEFSGNSAIAMRVNKDVKGQEAIKNSEGYLAEMMRHLDVAACHELGNRRLQRNLFLHHTEPHMLSSDDGIPFSLEMEAYKEYESERGLFPSLLTGTELEMFGNERVGQLRRMAFRDLKLAMQLNRR